MDQTRYKLYKLSNFLPKRYQNGTSRTAEDFGGQMFPKSGPDVEKADRRGVIRINTNP